MALLGVWLGRRPERGVEGVERLVGRDGEYRWHQIHVVRV